MNYKNIYSMFISSRKDQPLLKDEYYENHHIIPKCLGGTNDPQNLIKLTAREHFFAHLLLSKFAGPKMKIALTWFVNGLNLEKCKKKVSSRLIAKIREEANVARSHALTGRKFSDEHKDALSVAKKGKPTWNKGLTVEDERVKRNVELATASKRLNPKPAWNKGISGDDYKQHYKTGLTPPSMMGRIWINNGVEQRKILRTDIIPEGWTRGRCDNRGDNNPMKKRNQNENQIN